VQIIVGSRNRPVHLWAQRRAWLPQSATSSERRQLQHGGTYAGRSGGRGVLEHLLGRCLFCMAWICHFLFLFKFVALDAYAQTISTSLPLPPLQWLNLSGLLTGPAPPPLRDSSIAYDETTRSLLIFGGESEGGFVQSQTYM
jgi:hypothetical protein